MKNIHYILLLVVMIITASCSLNEPQMFSEKDSSVMFDKKSSTSIGEKNGTFKIPVVLAGIPGSGNVTASIEVVPGNDYKAIEGKDFVIENKNLSFPQGYGVDTVKITIKDNSVFEGDKTFKLKLSSANVKVGSYSEVVVTIADDEHPLALVIGDYSGADFKLKDGSQDGGNYDASINSISGSLTQVSIYNFWGGGETVIAEVNLEAKTIAMLPGQIIYIDSTNGNCYARYIDASAGKYDKTSPIVGTIDDKGNIVWGAWGAQVSAGFYGTYKKTTFTKK